MRAALDPAPALHAQLDAALADPAPVRLDDGAIAAGFDGELDAERALRDDSRRVIASLQLDYAQRYGVASLKIRHHAQLGYVIEAPAAAVEKLRDHADLTLRQGMANGARFTAPELSDLDRRISEAADRAAARERAVFATWSPPRCARPTPSPPAPTPWRCSTSRNPPRSSPNPAPGAARRSPTTAISASTRAATPWSRRRSPAPPPSCPTTATSRPTAACCC